MVSGSSRGGRLDPSEAVSLEIEFIGAGIYHPHRFVLSDIGVQVLRQEQRLLAVFALDSEPSWPPGSGEKLTKSARFHTALRLGPHVIVSPEGECLL